MQDRARTEVRYGPLEWLYSRDKEAARSDDNANHK